MCWSSPSQRGKGDDAEITSFNKPQASDSFFSLTEWWAGTCPQVTYFRNSPACTRQNKQGASPLTARQPLPKSTLATPRASGDKRGQRRGGPSFKASPGACAKASSVAGTPEPEPRPSPAQAGCGAVGCPSAPGCMGGVFTPPSASPELSATPEIRRHSFSRRAVLSGFGLQAAAGSCGAAVTSASSLAADLTR